VSTTGSTYTEVASGKFVAADRGHYNTVSLSGSTDSVKFVRFTIRAPMVLTDTATYGDNACSTPDAFSGCTYESVTEIEVYGSAS
jgi:hypothetical protein